MNKICLFLTLMFFVFLPAVLADLSDVSFDIDGGNYTSVEYIADNIYNFTFDQWIKFQIDNVQDKNLTIYAKTTREEQEGVLISSNWSFTCDEGITWNSFGNNISNTTDTKKMWHNFTECNTVIISRFKSYGYTKMETFLNSISNNNATISVIGQSVELRNQTIIRISNDNSNLDRKVVYLISRQHPQEDTGYMLESMINYLLSDSASSLRDKYIWYVLPSSNPDGLYRGLGSVTSEGYNMNRKWDTSDSIEVNNIKTHLTSIKNSEGLDVFIDFHGNAVSTGVGYFIGLKEVNTTNYEKGYFRFQYVFLNSFIRNSAFISLNLDDWINSRGPEYVSLNYLPKTSLSMEFPMANDSWSLAYYNQSGIDIANSIDDAFRYEDVLYYYKLNENQGTVAYDTSGNSNDGTISGATWNNDGIDVTLTSGYSINTDGRTFTLTDSDLAYTQLRLDYQFIENDVEPILSNYSLGGSNFFKQIPAVFTILGISLVIAVVVLLIIIITNVDSKINKL